MKHPVAFYCLILLALSGCQGMLDTVDRSRTTLRSNYVNTSNHVSSWFAVQDRTKRITPPYSPPRYCYRTDSDTLCYVNPIPGAEPRLIAEQPGTASYTDRYSYDAQTAPVVMLREEPSAYTVAAPQPVSISPLRPLPMPVATGPARTL